MWLTKPSTAKAPSKTILTWDSSIRSDPELNTASKPRSHQIRSSLKSPRRHHDNNHQTRNNQRARHRRHDQNTAPGRRKLAADDIVLALEISVEAQEQNQDGDT